MLVSTDSGDGMCGGMENGKALRYFTVFGNTPDVI